MPMEHLNLRRRRVKFDYSFNLLPALPYLHLKPCCFLLQVLHKVQQRRRTKCLLRVWVTVVVFTVDTSAVPQCWKNAVAKATSDLYHMEASMTVFLRGGRQSAVTWPLSPNRSAAPSACSICSQSTGSVLHRRETMLRPGGCFTAMKQRQFCHKYRQSILRQDCFYPSVRNTQPLFSVCLSKK